MPLLQNFLPADDLQLVPFPLALVFVTAVGALIGSFLNVVIHRLPREESVVFPSSRCPSCGAAIKPYDNVPVLSWLVLRGRCRSCKAAINARDPAVEALTALLFALVLLQTGLTAGLLPDLVFTAALVALVFIDAEHMILPDAITLPGVGFALVARALVPNLYGVAFLCTPAGCPPAWALSLANAVLGAVAAGGFLWGVGWLWERLRDEEAMGLGDVKMMLMVGAYLGWPLALLTIFLGVLSGSVVGLALIATGRSHLKSRLPFGVYLGVAAYVSLLYGRPLVEWYASQF